MTPAELERALREAMQNPAYDWRLPPPSGAVAKPSWLVSFIDRMVLGTQAVFHQVGEWLKRLFEALSGRSTPVAIPGAPPSAGLHWSLYVLMTVVIMAAIWIVWRKLRMKHPRAKNASEVVQAVPLEADRLTADRLPEEKWNELAEQSLRAGDGRIALRAFYLASLAWLGRREFLALDPGKTDREYELELQRRARGYPDARKLFSANTAAFERAWYGMHEVRPEEIGAFRGRIEDMKAKLGAAA